jgi:hypothetical protein
MVDEYKVPNLRDALKETEKDMPGEPERKIVIPYDGAPPPPRDWVSHPITKTIGILILVAIGIVLWHKLPQWIIVLQENMWGTGLVIFLVVLALLFIATRASKATAMGDWDTKMTEVKPKVRGKKEE